MTSTADKYKAIDLKTLIAYRSVPFSKHGPDYGTFVLKVKDPTEYFKYDWNGRTVEPWTIAFSVFNLKVK